MRGMVLFSMVMAALPGLAEAEVALERPASCKAALTIQKRGCEVETVYRCDAGRDEFFRSEEFDAEGFDGIAHSTLGNDLIFEADPDGSFRMESNAVGTRTTPIAELLATGQGREEQAGTFSLFGISKPVSLTATLAVTDRAFRVGDVSLTRIEAEAVILLPKPMTPVNARETRYFHAESGVTFVGESALDLFSDGVSPNAPVEVILPGQPGFGANQPLYDCGEFSMTLPTPEHGEPA